jgi:hypothetical protein
MFIHALSRWLLTIFVHDIGWDDCDGAPSLNAIAFYGVDIVSVLSLHIIHAIYNIMIDYLVVAIHRLLLSVNFWVLIHNCRSACDGVPIEG